ncbi:MAG: lysophospholipase L1-like esterase [Candidatus Latescibacterota bacterium]
MKNRCASIVITLFLGSLFVWGGCGQDSERNALGPGQPFSVEWRQGDAVVALGTSLTFGYGAGCKVLPLRTDCIADSAYPALLAKRLFLPIVNLGQPGATTRDGLLRTEEAIALAPVLALVEFGGNDLVQGIAVEEARANLEEMIGRFHAEGIAVVLLSSTHPDMIENTPAGHRLAGLTAATLAYHAMLVDLAATRKLPLVGFLFEGVWWKRELMYDSLHPNGMGYVRMEENIFRSLRDFLAANEMLK